MTAVALALPTLWLDDDTRDVINDLQNRLAAYQPTNSVKAEYYAGKQRLHDLGIAIPPMLRTMTAAIGWPATAVDVLEERLDLRGWSSPETDFMLDDVFADNDVDVQSSLAHLDALIYGCAFVAVSTGWPGEPDPLITVESPTTMTAIVSARTRRVVAALSVDVDNDPLGTRQIIGANLYLPDETLMLTRSAFGGVWTLEDRDEHLLGRVPVAQLINRPRAGDLDGHSEITPTVISYTNTAMRTLAASEVAREFHASPQRYVLGAPENFFLDGEGNPRGAWESYLGRILAIERDESGEIPTVGEFRGSNLGSYFEMIRTLSQLLAAESSIPAHYLGFVTDNPTSADAIRQGEARLIKRVERRQAMFGRAWTEVARLVVLIRDGVIPDGFSAVRPEWVNAATPTKAADADRVTKLISAGVLRPDSAVTWAELGFTAEQQQALRQETDELEREQEQAAPLVVEQAAPVVETPPAIPPGTETPPTG